MFIHFLIWATQGGGAMFVYVLYRNPNRWMDLDEIWHIGGPWGREGSGFFLTQYPHPSGTECIKRVWGVSGATAVCFDKNFIKQKLQGTPDLVGVGHLFGPQIWIWKDLGPMSFWRHGHSLWRVLDKTNVVVYVPNSYLVRLDTLYPGSKGGQKGDRWGSVWSLSSAFWQKLYKTKIVGHPQYSGGGTSLDAQIQIWKDCAQCASGAVVPHFQEEFIRQ